MLTLPELGNRGIDLPHLSTKGPQLLCFLRGGGKSVFEPVVYRHPGKSSGRLRLHVEDAEGNCCFGGGIFGE